MNGYEKLKKQNEDLKKSLSWERHRSTAYFLAIVNTIDKDKNPEQFKKAVQTARYILSEYKSENDLWEFDPLLKWKEEENEN